MTQIHADVSGSAVGGADDCVTIASENRARDREEFGYVGDLAGAGLLLTSDALARLLRISKRSLMRLRSRGKLPRPIQLGRSVRWRTAEIREWVEAGCPPMSTWESTAAPRRARVFSFRRTH
ncbi:MAG: DNA-binding protein [Planctomycetaceae bacterium]|nr:DNA-binding protein [Planctomycetaceae bacterium]